MPHAVQLAYRVLHADEDLELFVFDLPDYYHNLYLGTAQELEGGVGPPMTLKELRAIGFPVRGAEGMKDEDLFQPCYVTLNMGDGKGVLLSQQVHESVLAAAQVNRGDLLGYGLPRPPRKVPWKTAYVDDFSASAEVKKTGKRGSSLAAADAWRAKAAYAAIGLDPKAKKSAEGVRRMKVIGGAVDGVDGPVGAPVHVVGQLMTLTTLVAADGATTGEILQRLLGGWICPPYVQERRAMLA